MMYFLLGAFFCPLLAFCGVRLIQRFFGKKPHFLINRLLLPLLLAFPFGILLHQAKVRDDTQRKIREKKHEAYWRVKEPELLAELVADPELALRDHWYGLADYEKYTVFHNSLRDQQVSYSLDQLDRIYQVDPESREYILVHPACDLPFLEKAASRILLSEQGDTSSWLLYRLVSHSAASRELLMRIEKAIGSRAGQSIPGVRQVIDARLRGVHLVLHMRDSLRVKLPHGELYVTASSDVLRGYQWDDVTRMAALASTTAAVPGDPDVYFQARTRDSGQAGVTRLGEFREGIRRFGTVEEASRWLGQQSAEIPTIYRNDGLVVSSSKSESPNLLTVEVWQILIGGEKPSSLPGARDAALVSGKVRR
ncbi:MAG: hypothetical protein EOP88_11260 [Verrucomicrobiaceae bacterium]|nr:MAG: hypothetical protein EOP88_11260 [Verrucomicrobiaceae bacterium]